MKFLSTRDLRNRPGYVRELAEKEDVVLTANGKPFGILLAVKEDDLEETARLIRQARALRAVSQIRKSAAVRGLDKMSLAEINAVIRDVRSKRK